MKVTSDKNCFCETCQRRFHYLGIAAHRARHYRLMEDCTIRYSSGEIFTHDFSRLLKGKQMEEKRYLLDNEPASARDLIQAAKAIDSDYAAESICTSSRAAYILRQHGHVVDVNLESEH